MGDKPLRWLAGEIKSPPFSSEARLEAGFLLRRLQSGEALAMPESRPLPSLGARCHELRIRDGGKHWRVVYRVDREAILVLEIFAKSSRRLPKHVMRACRRRLAEYDHA